MIQNIDENKERYIGLMKKVKRPGIEKLLTWLEESDFYQAPASTKYHLCTPSGLCLHSLNVYDALLGLLENEPDDDDYYQFKVNDAVIGRWKQETLIICALAHDICKINFYTQERKNRKVYRDDGKKRDSEGAFDWESYMAYAVNDTLPYGHGEKSVMLLQMFVPTTFEERFAIRWHMGAFGISANEERAFMESCKKYPLVFLMHQADQIASYFIEDYEENKITK